ncbi:peptidylprolyl isomerase [Altererythrobacter confluentis]|uniref:Peptidylprolyl isomerase n=1 Tax=Allopontixanthobacter confluentis TaxID=1849021 RepID=A0A6L7GJK2_9SPHN|nr:peptidylprolyl isomerase [Allopontixanthobacter confluentis]MXP14801.1 peptidylprolyl isomerase [Allopontixanthobacter confluentis]
MKNIVITALALCLSAPAFAQEQAVKDAPAPSEIVEAAKPAEWTAIAPQDLLVMTLAADAEGTARQVIIQLLPAPFSQRWVSNIRTLASDHWWDNTSINRVQDNYVVQWGDPTEEKPLPEGILATSKDGYETGADSEGFKAIRARLLDTARERAAIETANTASRAKAASAKRANPGKNTIVITRPIPPLVTVRKDPYAGAATFENGWPIALDKDAAWPVHCYGMVGVGRGYAPDAGSGAELYVVIGHAPRHLDRNIALVGRVIEGIEHMSSLPRGKGGLGFYEDPSKRVPIVSIRLASELAPVDRPAFEYLSTQSVSFADYADARSNRRDPFFIVPAGGADICNIPVPVRRMSAD